MKSCNQNKKVSIENMTKNLGAFQWLLLNMLGFGVVVSIVYYTFDKFDQLFEPNLDLLSTLVIFFFIPGFIGIIDLLILRKGLLKIFDKDKGKWNLFKKPTFKKVLFWIMFVVYVIPILFFIAFTVYWIGVLLFANVTWYLQNR